MIIIVILAAGVGAFFVFQKSITTLEPVSGVPPPTAEDIVEILVAGKAC